MQLGSNPILPPANLPGLVAGLARNAAESARLEGKVAEERIFPDATDAFMGDTFGALPPEEGQNAALEALEAFDDTSLLGYDFASSFQLGSEGTVVKALQRGLNAMGAAPPLVADGDYGRRTEQAVRDFQRAVGLDDTGVAGPETLGAMMAVENLAAASLTDDPDQVAQFARVAQAALACMPEGSVPQALADQVAELVERNLVLQDPGCPSLAEGGEADGEIPLDAELSMVEEGGEIPLDAQLTMVPESPSAAIEEAVAVVAQADASTGGDSDGILALATPEWVATAPKEALAKALELMGDDFWTDDEEAGLAGRLAAQLYRLDAEALPQVWAGIQAGAGGNNLRAFSEGFVAGLGHAGNLERVVGDYPEIMREMADATAGGVFTSASEVHQVLLDQLEFID